MMPEVRTYNKGNNACWVRHQWFSQLKSDIEADELITQLKSLEIKTIYIHTGPFDSKGNIPKFNISIWKNNLKKIKKRLPDLKILAWLGGLNQVKFGKAADTLDLNNPSVLKRIAWQSGNLVNSCSFDGIHYDIEPIPDNDKNFLTLLKFTRNIIGNKLLSIATPYNISNDGMTRALNQLGNKTLYLWGPSYFKSVAKYADEIAVMSYDSISVTPASYKRFIIRQIKIITGALNGTGCRLYVGIPTYHDNDLDNRDKVENIGNAIEGVILGLQRTPYRNVVKGVAIYALWTTEEKEIDTYRKLWIGK
jgi:hypothetical protein